MSLDFLSPLHSRWSPGDEEGAESEHEELPSLSLPCCLEEGQERMEAQKKWCIDKGVLGSTGDVFMQEWG